MRLWLELIKRGHEIVYVTTDYLPALNVSNITQIILENSYECIKELNFVRNRFEGTTWLNFMHNKGLDLSVQITEKVYKNPAVMELYAPNSNVTFDVIMTKLIYSPSLTMLGHRFNAPLIDIL